MAKPLIPWQRYLSDVAHKSVGYPNDEKGGEDTMIINVDAKTGACDKTFNEIVEAAQTQDVIAIINPSENVFYYARVAATSIEEVEEKEVYLVVFIMLGHQGSIWNVTAQKATAEAADSIVYFDNH